MKSTQKLLLSNKKLKSFVCYATEEQIKLLAPEELIIWNTKVNRRKKFDWLSARISAKVIIRDWLKQEHKIQLSPEQIAIFNTPIGEPLIKWPIKMGTPNLSLSHKDGIGLALISDISKIGCDIELIRNRHPRFKQYFLTTNEIEILYLYNDSLNQLTAAVVETILWSAKESVIKAILPKSNISFFDILISFRDVKNTGGELEFTALEHEGKIEYFIFDSYVITIASIRE